MCSGAIVFMSRTDAGNDAHVSTICGRMPEMTRTGTRKMASR